VHDIHELLKQENMSPNGSYTRTNEDAVEPLVLEALRDDGLGGVANIGEAQLRVVSEALSRGFVSVQGGLDLGSIQAGESGVVGRREINELWLQANDQHTCSCGHMHLWDVYVCTDTAPRSRTLALIR
jgi:hypothetical protein